MCCLPLTAKNKTRRVQVFPELAGSHTFPLLGAAGELPQRPLDGVQG